MSEIIPVNFKLRKRIVSLLDVRIDPFTKAVTLGKLGKLARRRGDLDAAEKFYKQSLSLNKNLGCKEGIWGNYRNLASLEKVRGNPEVALGYWIKAMLKRYLCG